MESTTETSGKDEEQAEEETQLVEEITPQTRLKDLLKQYPELKNRLPEIAPQFKMLNTPLGKLMIGKVNVQMMSDRSGVPVDKLIEGIHKITG